MELTVTLAQVNPTTADVRGNTALVLDALERAADAGADVVVLPEMAITGYCILDLIEDAAFVDANLAALDYLRERTGATAAVVGFVDRDARGTYNAAAVLQDGAIRGVARKVLLPNYRYFDDERYFEPGETVAPVPIEVGGEPVDLGVSVCEDMWDEEYDRKPVSELARAGADLLVNVNASPFAAGKRTERHEIVRRHVAATGLPFCYLNTVGAADVGKNVVVFDGDSLVYGADGTLLATGARFAEDRVTVTLELGGTPSSRGTPDRLGTAGTPASWSRDDGSAPVDEPTPAAGPVAIRRERELYEALVAALRDYVAKTGFETVLEPVSGGIDSSLGLAICVDALGPERVVAVNLPSVVNTEATKGVARELAANLGVEYRVLPVQSIYDEVIATYEGHVGEIERETARENVYARLRGLLMMLASNDSPAEAPSMLVSNGNETEMALGYVTLYGDMAGGLDLLGDLSKTDVYALAAYVNEHHGREVIPAAAFEAAPSAELTPGQVDPFDYPTVAPIVDDLLERRWDPAEIVRRFADEALDAERYGRDDRDRTVYERYDADAFAAVVYDTYERMTRSTFKRVQAPPVIAVSERAFGTDFREPIINRWDGRPVDWTASE